MIEAFQDSHIHAGYTQGKQMPRGQRVVSEFLIEELTSLTFASWAIAR